jgi:hypothetical protein
MAVPAPPSPVAVLLELVPCLSQLGTDMSGHVGLQGGLGGLDGAVNLNTQDQACKGREHVAIMIDITAVGLPQPRSVVYQAPIRTRTIAGKGSATTTAAQTVTCQPSLCLTIEMKAWVTWAGTSSYTVRL